MVADFLRSMSLFKDLDEEALACLEAVAREERHAANRLVFREGDPVDAFYMVRDGAVTVFRDAPGKPLQVLARLTEGGFFGEMGLLNRAARVASARTAAPTTLLRIDKEDLLAVLAGNPGLELKFRSEVIRRHGMNVSALLGLAGQRDVRIRLGVAVIVEPPEGSPFPAVLENLSLGGVALSGIAAGWRLGEAVRFRLGPADEPSLLEVRGTVTWREGDAVGIAFDPAIVGHDASVHRALRSFLDARK